MSDYKDIYVCGNFIKRIANNQSYVLVADADFFSNVTAIDQNYVIYENTRDVYFDSVEINYDITINGELVIN